MEEQRSLSLVSDRHHHLDHKAGWDEIVLHATRMEVVEEWLRRIIKGPVCIGTREQRPTHKLWLRTIVNKSATQV